MAKHLILAATSGIGQATCRLLCERGHSLFLTSRSRDKVLPLAEECKAAYK